MTLKNTDNEYRIIISNEQTIDNETDKIEETAYGSYYEKNGKRYILYKTETDGDTVSSLIKAEADKVSIKRSGLVNTLIVYKAGEKRKFMYKLPYGEIEMELDTQSVDIALSRNGGEIKLVYLLTVQGETYYNSMKITITKR